MLSIRNYAPLGGRKKVIFRNLIIVIVILSAINLIYFSTNDISQIRKLLRQPGVQLENYVDDVEELIDRNYFVKTPG